MATAVLYEWKWGLGRQELTRARWMIEMLEVRAERERRAGMRRIMIVGDRDDTLINDEARVMKKVG